MALSVGTIACRLIQVSSMAISLVSLMSCNQDKTKAIEEDSMPFYNSASFDAEWISKEDKHYHSIHTIDTFSLQDQRGLFINKDSLNGHIYVANFFFTACPSICPKMTSNLFTLQQSFIDNPTIKLVSFSVMPWADSVGRLKEYGKTHNINPTKWHLLTGNNNRIYELGRTSYFAEKGLGLKKKSSEFLHTESMLLIDKQGRIRGIYNATQKTDIERVTEDINTLLKEG